MTTQKKSPSIDKQFEQLEKLIAQLENDTLPIEKALACYEESMQIVANCKKDLAAIEQKVSVYQDSKLQPLDTASDD